MNADKANYTQKKRVRQEPSHKIFTYSAIEFPNRLEK
jgi:hypothetical protein